jgi:hypothetical protein
MNPISDAALDAIQHKNGETLVLSLLSHGGEDQVRLALCAMSDDGFESRHDKLFSDLACIARPPLVLDSISQDFQIVQSERPAESAGLRMWQDGEWGPVTDQSLRDVQLVSFEGSSCTVRYSYRGQEHAFTVDSSGASMDADSVIRAFNELMKRIGREDRAFRLKGPGGEDAWAMFLCANETLFRQAAATLHIPLIE